MAKDCQDIQQLDSEDSDQQLGRGEGPGPCGHGPRREDRFCRRLPPHRPLLLQRLCSGFRLSLLVLGFNVLMLVAICVIGSQRAQLEEDLRILKENFSHFSSGVLMELGVLLSDGSGASSQLTSLEAKLEKQQRDVKADHATLLLHLKHFPSDLRILTCQVAFFQSNGTDCCPVNWLEYEGSCYWFSRSGKTWEEAEKYCQLESAHLVVVNSREEQRHRRREKQAPCREPDVGLDPGTPGSRSGPKAGAKPLSHTRIPYVFFLIDTFNLKPVFFSVNVLRLFPHICCVRCILFCFFPYGISN